MVMDDEFKNAVLEKLGEINGKFDTFHAAVDKRLDAVHRTLHGNGQPGIAGEVAILKQQMGEVRGADASAGKASKAAAASIGALLLGLGGMILQWLGIAPKP